MNWRRICYPGFVFATSNTQDRGVLSEFDYLKRIKISLFIDQISVDSGFPDRAVRTAF